VSDAYPRQLGRAFADAEVVRNYAYRPSYPPEVFAVLRRLLVPPETVLDAGCGSGALTRGLAEFAVRVDAVDPSEAMLEEARRLSGDDPRIHWILGRAEDVPLRAPYGVIATGASLHWMDPMTVMPRFREALAPGARLVIVDMENIHPAGAAREEFISVIERHSALGHHDDFGGLIADLEAAGHFAPEGEYRTSPVPFEQTIDDYFAMLASTSSLSRAALGDRSEAFEREARAVLSRHGVERIRFDVVGLIAWGQPLQK
jgi:SAM-dependent methyltransferase